MHIYFLYVTSLLLGLHLYKIVLKDIPDDNCIIKIINYLKYAESSALFNIIVANGFKIKKKSAMTCTNVV